MLNIKTVTVIGATGTMGTNVAGIFASFGNAKVYMVGCNLENFEREQIGGGLIEFVNDLKRKFKVESFLSIREASA